MIKKSPLILFLFFFFTGILFLGEARSVVASELKLALAEASVDITPGFNGGRIVVFGTTDSEGASILLSLTGPETSVLVRKKEPVAGAWLNRKAVEFRRVPLYHDYALSGTNNGEYFELSVFPHLYVGAFNLDFYSEQNEDPEVLHQFRQILVSRMQQKGFFPLESRGVDFVGDRFFRSVFPLPANVPTGTYRLEGYLIQGDKVIATDRLSFQVGQVGFNAKVYLSAQNDPIFYACLTVFICVACGWGAFSFLRRD